MQRGLKVKVMQCTYGMSNNCVFFETLRGKVSPCPSRDGVNLCQRIASRTGYISDVEHLICR
jgi:hypothetical protein